MANDSRSTRKVKEDESSNSKTNVLNGKGSGPPASLSGGTDTSGLRRSARETRKQMTESPPNMRKSERLEKRMPATPEVKKKSEKAEIQTALSPLRRSDRGKKQSSPSSSGSKMSGKGCTSSDTKGKRGKDENSLKQMTVDTSKIIRNETLDLELAVRKRKAMNARSYKALFKSQRRRITEEDDDQGLKIPDSLPQIDSGSNGDMYEEVEIPDQLPQIDSISDRVSGAKSVEEKDLGGSQCSVRQGIEGTLDDTVAALVDHSKMGSGPPEFGSFTSAGKSPDRGSPNGGSEDSGSGDRSRSPNKTIYIPEMDSDSCAVTTNKDTQTSRVDAAASPLSKKHNSNGTCATCFEKLRLHHDLEQHEGICSCHTTLTKDLDAASIPKESGELEPSAAVELEGNDNTSTLRKETSSNVQIDYNETLCMVCKTDGTLILCDGKGCKGGYHPSCLDPPLENVPPRVWHCPICVEKKIKLGVQSVSDGIESIWDSREGDVSNAEGLQKQKQYLVKYKGLAHVHNQWIPASELLREAPLLLTKFDRKNQGVKYNAQWTVPHRLLKKRLLVSLKQRNEYNSKHPGKALKCHYEWLVKWCGRSYVDATWELENASFLCSNEGQRLIRDYVNRYQKGKGAVTPDKTEKKAIVILSELPTDCPPGINDSHLRYVNKLLECWSKGQSAVVFDFQERVTRIIIFILSLRNACHPFLVITTPNNVKLWENEFSRLSSSINFLAYNGNQENRESIRMLEFYGEGDQIIFQVLLSSLQAFVEDSKILETIRWEAVILDDCQSSKISSHFQQIKTLLAETRILLFNSPMKEKVAEYRNVLSLLGSDGNVGDVTGSGTVSDDNLGKLKECLSRFIAYECISNSSRFVEYWVPVQISNMQLEQYCATLLSNTMALCSCLKNDPVGALRDVLVSSLKALEMQKYLRASVRLPTLDLDRDRSGGSFVDVLIMCCDHPYIVDPLLQSSVTKDLPPAEYLDIGIKASGKLQLLDIMLLELKKRQLRVVILFQPITGTGKEPISIGDILDDFVRQRFGQDSYERVDGGVIVTAKRQAALNNFNKDKGRFVFLLDHRACLAAIKLSSVDTIIIFDSDLNPMNDLRSLQKITIDAQPRQIKIFRLYAYCTVEERVLFNDLPPDSKLQNLHRSTSDSLLMWGASYLFSKLDEFHSSSISSISCEQPELNNVVAEILDLISENCKSKDTTNSIITSVEHSGGTYSKNLTLFGKRKVQLQGEQPNTFWRKLLDGRNPRWKYLSVSTPRQRKRIYYSEESPGKSDLGNEEVTKKQKKMAVICADLSSLNPVAEEGTSGVSANFVPQSVPTERLRSTEVQQETSVAGTSLHSLLQLDVSRLCQILKLSEEINAMIGRFLKYIIDNHRVSKEPASILQAFLISLCWIGASLVKRKIDKKESLGLAKKYMKFSCTEEEAISVYSKLKLLKEMFLSNTQNIVEPESSNDSQRASDSTAAEPIELGKPNSASLKLQGVKHEIEGAQSQYVGEKLILTKQRQSGNCGIANKDTLESRKQVQKELDNQMLAEKHQKELEELNLKWENKKRALKKVHQADSALIRSVYSNLSLRLGKLKALDNEHAMKMEEYKRQRDIDLEDLKARHLSEARLTTARGLEEATFSMSEGRPQNEPTLHDSQNRKLVENSEDCEYGTQSGSGNVVPLSRHLMQRQSLDGGGSNLYLNEVVVADIPDAPSNGTVGCNIPTKGATALVTHSGNDIVETMASEKGSATMTSHPSDGGCSSDGANSFVSSSPPNMENQIQLAAECETAPNEVLECLDLADIASSPTESNKEKSGADASGHDMLNAGRMQNDEIPYSNSDNSPACDHRVSEDLDVQNDCPQPLSCSRMEVEDVQGDKSSSPQYDSPLQPVVTEQCDQSNGDGQVEVAPDGLHVIVSANLDHSQSQPNSPIASRVVDVPSSSGPIISNNYADSHQLVEELADVSDNVTLQDGEILERHPLIDAELPIEENWPEWSGGGTLDHQPLGGLQNSSQNAEALPQEVLATVQLRSLSDLHTGPNLSIGQGSDSQNQVLPIGENRPESSGGGAHDHQPPGGLQNSSQNAAAAVEATVQHPSLSGLYNGPNLSISQGSDSQYQVVSRMPAAAGNSADPLQNELERLRKEMDHVTKFHDDTKLRLKSECDKEVAEAIAQINSKYESKRQSVEAELMLKRKELDANHNKVLMNKVLADAFRSKCLDLRPPGAMGLQHAVPSSFLQQLHQLSRQTAPPRPAPVVASSSAAQPSVSQHTTAPPLRFVNNSAALFSSSSTRPPSINPITPSAGNVRVSGEIRSPAPHIQPFRPSTSASPSSLASFARMMSSQHAQGSGPAATAPAPLTSSRPQSPSPSQPAPLSTNHPSLHGQHTASCPSLTSTLPPIPSFCTTPPSPLLPSLSTIHSGLTSNHAPNPLSATSLAIAEAASQQRSRSSSPSPSSNLSGRSNLQRSGSLSGTSPSLPQASSRPPPPLTNQSPLQNQDTPSTLPVISSSLPQSSSCTPPFSTNDHVPNSLPASSVSLPESSSRQPSPAMAPQPSIQPVVLPSAGAPQPSLLPPIRDVASIQSRHTPDSLPATSSLSQPQSQSLPTAPSLPSLPPLLANRTGLYNKPSQLQSARVSSSTPNNLSSMTELLLKTMNQAGETQPNSSPPLPDFGSNFETLDLSQFGTAAVNEHVSSAPSTIAADVVCLSDDD